MDGRPLPPHHSSAREETIPRRKAAARYKLPLSIY
jgi:hypothetical protein